MSDEIGFGAPVVLSQRDIPHVRCERDESVPHWHCLRVLSQSGTLRAFRLPKRKHRAAAKRGYLGSDADRAIFQII